MVGNLSEHLEELTLAESGLLEGQRALVRQEKAALLQWQEDNPKPTAAQYAAKLDNVRRALVGLAKVADNGTVTIVTKKPLRKL